MPKRRVAGLAITGALLAGGLLAYEAGRGEPGPPSQVSGPKNLTLQASPRTIDEGDFVQLLASAENPDGGALDYTWDLGDGSEERSGSDLTSISHRYLQDRAGYTVRVTVTSDGGGTAEKTIRVLVDNAPPEVRVIERDGRALVGEPLGLRATATDPGPLDELTFTWDFGDGETGKGSSVSHAFQEDGRYTVTVTVADGDGGQDSATLDVVVGLGHQLIVGGDVAGFLEGQVSIQGQPMGNGRCYVRFWFLSEDGEVVHFPGFSLQSVLRGGFRVADYAIGAMPKQWFELDVAMGAPDLFFGELGMEPDKRTLPSGVVEEEILAGFRSHGGVLSVNYADETYVEGTFQVRMEETGHLFYEYQRHANVVGHFAARLASGEDGDMPAFYIGVPGYRCRPTETFDIADRTPEPNQANVDWQNPEIMIDFTEAVDASSIAENVRVDYRLPDVIEGDLPWSQYRTVAGGWTVDPADDHRIRFTPQAPLIDGVIYCIRVHSGERGIRGAKGQVLDYVSPGFDWRTVRACAEGSPWGETVEWAFYTIPELDVRARVYQVHRNVKLVPEKSTLTRVLWDWHPKQGMHPEAQVDSIPADVRVEAQGTLAYPAKLRRTVLRSDRFSRQDTINADNGMKFFGWRPTSGSSVTIRATVEPSDQRGSPSRRFEGTTPQPIERWDRSPSLTFDYYFVRIAEWADSVPSADKVFIHNLIIGPQVPFVTQNFPVTSTQSRFRGEVAVDPPLLGHQWRGFTNLSADVIGWRKNVSLSHAVGWELWNLATPTDADAIVGVVPPSVGRDEGFGGLMISFSELGWGLSRVLGGKRVILIQGGGEASPHVLAHELGHWFSLCHTNDPPEATRDCVTGPWTFEGFRVRDSNLAGWNKDEGNPQALDDFTRIPLMFTEAHGDHGYPPLDDGRNVRFITREHYLRVLENASRVRLSSAPPSAQPLHFASILPPLIPRQPSDPATVTVVEGLVDADATAAAIRSVTPGQRTSSAPSEPGPFTLRSYDGDGREIDAISFKGEEALAIDAPPDTAGSGLRFFRLGIREEEAIARVVVEHEGTILVEKERSSNPPTVTFLEPSSGTTLTGRVLVRWRSDDADGDPVMHRLRYSPDGESWQVLAWATAQSAYALATEDLTPGPSPRLELTASDGFNETVASLELRLPRKLHVVSRTPAEGQALGDGGTVEVTFLEPLDAGTVTNQALSLRGPDGTEVFADVIYTPGSNRLAIVPVDALAAGTHTATLHAGIMDRIGNRLAEDLSWRVESASGAAPTAKAEAHAVEAADDPVAPVDASGDPTRPSGAAGDALGPDGVRWASLIAAGRPNLSFEGSGVDGSAGAGVSCYGPDNPVFISIYEGDEPLAAELGLNVNTVTGIAEGATGTFRISEIQYVLSGGALRTQGTGTLEVTRHDASKDKDRRRMSGRISGMSVRDPISGEFVTFEAEFDVNAACTPFGR